VNKRTFLVWSGTAAIGRQARAGGDTPRLRYGGDAAFAPFESLDARGRPHGFQIDLLAELGPAAGVEFDIALRPWPETEAAFREGQRDVVAMVETAPRRAWARFTRGVATPVMTVYHRRGRPDPQGLQDLAGLRIAVLDRDAMLDTISTALAGVPGPFLRVAQPEAALAAVRDDRADVALLLRAYADPLLVRFDDIEAAPLNLPLQTYALAVAPERDGLRVQLQRGLDILEAGGRIEALRLKWLRSHRDLAERLHLEHDVVRQRARTWVVAGTAVTALTLMGGALWQRSRRIATETQRRLEVESALLRAEDVLARTFAHHADPMLIVEEGEGVVRDANAALLALLGLPSESVIGQPLDRVAAHVDSGALQQLVDSLARDGTLMAVPLRLTRADGLARDCLVSADHLVIDGAPHVFCIVRDITEQLTVDAALRAEYDVIAAQLAKSRRERDDARAGQARAEGSLQEFTRAVAHDLKTPLTAVQGFAGLLRHRLQAGHVQEALGYTDRIDRAARRMTAMINALSNLSQVTRQSLRREPVDMQAVVEETWSLLTAAHPARKTEFRLEALPPAEADPDLAVQVWQNLLDNAAKYSALVAHPVVRVDCHQDDQRTWYRVTDNGDGFDMAGAQALFQPFQRMHSASQFEGTGVGLSLVRRIVEHHGGDVRIRSAPGVGTVVEFTLDPAPPVSPSHR